MFSVMLPECNHRIVQTFSGNKPRMLDKNNPRQVLAGDYYMMPAS